MFSLFHAPRKYPQVYLPYSDRLNFYDGRDKWLESIADIPPEAVHLFSLHWLHLEVYNGGFWQYFYNSTCTCVPEAIAGFRAIGMPDVADLVTGAAKQLGEPFPFDLAPRRVIVGEPFEGKRMDFAEKDTAFYQLADTERLIFRRLPKFVPFADAYAASAAARNSPGDQA